MAAPGQWGQVLIRDYSRQAPRERSKSLSNSLESRLDPIALPGPYDYRHAEYANGARRADALLRLVHGYLGGADVALPGADRYQVVTSVGALLCEVREGAAYVVGIYD